MSDPMCSAMNDDPKESRRGGVTGLDAFYLGATLYLAFEALTVLFWFVLATVIVTVLDTAEGSEFRSLLGAVLFHFTAPLSMASVVQQLQNNNSVTWWIFFGFSISLSSEIITLLILFKHISRDLLWPWQSVLALSIVNTVGTTFAVIWYTVWFLIIRPSGIPIPVSKRKFAEHRHDPTRTTPLLSKIWG